MQIVDESVNVMDAQGQIIASGDLSRLGERHEGAVLALAENRVVEIDQSMANRLHGVRPGINLPIAFHQQLLGVVGISGAPETVRRYGEFVRMTAELIIEQAALLEEIQWDRRHREELILQLVKEPSRSESLQSLARHLGIDLSLPRVVAIVSLREAEEAASGSLRELVQLLEHPERHNLVAISSLQEAVVLKPIQLDEGVWQVELERKKAKELIERATRHKFEVDIALGHYFPGVQGLAQSYQTATATLRAGRIKHPGKRIYFYQDYRLAVLLDHCYSPWKLEQLRAPLQKLQQQDPKKQLRKTLKHYLDQSCDLNHAARSLHIHPNTLRYRLNQIQQITALDLNQLDDLLQLYLALKI